MRLSVALPVLFCTALGIGVAQAQQVAFAGLKTDITAAVEVTADTLSVNQTAGNALFTGNVLIVQGPMRLQAQSVQVEYGNAERSRISRLVASGGVTLVTETEAAEAQEAVYDVANGKVDLRGEVLLTQGQNVLSGQHLTIDLTTGMGQMEGRVRTLLQPGTQP